MGYVTLEFLGKEYSVSEAAKDFLEYDKILVKTVNRLSAKVLEKRRRDASLGANSWLENMEADIQDYEREMRSVADHYVDILIAHGIYDVSRDELIRGIESFEDVRKIAAYSGQQALEGAQLAVEAKRLGMQEAYELASSNISGSGVMVFTSNIAALAAMALFESGVLMSQAKKADWEYRKTSEALSRYAVNEIDRVCNRIADQTYYPGLTAFLMDYAHKLTTAFLSEMTAQGAFDFESVEEYNKVKADNMLKNLHKVPDKKSLLTKSFLTCPFTEEVYKRAFDEGYMDAGTLATAKYFGYGKLFSKKIEEGCRASVSQPARFEMFLELLMEDRGLNRKEALAIVYDGTMKALRKKMDEIVRVLQHPDDLSHWIMVNVATDAVKLCKMSESDIATTVTIYMGRTVSKKSFDKLSDAGLLDEAGASSLSDEGAYELFCAKVSEDLSKAVCDHADALRARVERLLSEYNEMKRARDAKAMELEGLQRGIEERKANLAVQRKALGFFKLKEKRRIGEELDAADKEMLAVQEAYDIKKADKQLHEKLAAARSLEVDAC